jgi:hypothetical protein
MTRLLDRAGCPQEVLNLIPPIVQTCGPCRAWAKPQPENVATIDIPESFNSQVEADLMFVYDNIIFHMIDRTTRWYQGWLISDKEETTLMDRIDEWCRLHGPMKEFIMDQETGIQASATVLEFFNRRGIKYDPRAKGQQVPYIDRRGSLVRDTIHKIVAQLQVEKIKMPFKYVYSEAAFCGNAMLTINGSTPYNAVYGRVPALLPSIDSPDAINEATLGHPGTIRYTHRLREISVQAMIEETAKLRASRALQTRTIPAGQLEQYKPGDLVDFYRPIGSKDAAGWTGPAKIIDPTHLDKGTITIRHVHRPIEVRIGDLRRHLPFLVFLAAEYSSMNRQALTWSMCRMYVDSHVGEHKTITIGHMFSGGKWNVCPQTRDHLKFYHSAILFARNCLGFKNACALRIGKGCGSCPPLTKYSLSHVVFWFTDTTNVNHMNARNDSKDSSNKIGGLNWRQMYPDTWTSLRFMQILCTSDSISHFDDVSTVADEQPHEESRTTELMGPDHDLATIPEGTEPSEDSFLFINDDISLAAACKEANIYSAILSDDLSTTAPSESADSEDFSVEADSFEPLGDWDDVESIPSYYHLMAANVRAGLPTKHALDAEEETVELYYEGPMYKLLALDPEDRVVPGQDEILMENIYKSSSKHKNKAAKKAVVERKDHDLSKEEQTKHWPEVAASMKKELATWVELKCISRKSRSTARNIIDCRWVVKWKLDTAVKDASSTDENGSRWVIRSRLCLRGFKDLDAKDLDSYAGTAQRCTQRLLVSEAVIRRWPICTTDISKAFLQGVTYEELAAATGEPLREVNFYLPEYAVAFLKELPGWENFDPRTEVIHCDKPGTGCNDAPRCFSLKLAKVTKDICGMQSCTVDNELCMLHETYKPGGSHTTETRKRLKALMAKHVDDLKMTGDRATIIWILEKIQEVFGKLKIDWHDFTNCGVRHRQNPETKVVTLDQDAYVKGIKLCVHADISSAKPESLCCTDLHSQYWSVCGAIAYAVLTRPDIAVFVAALQRWSHAPQVIHVKRLNAVVRWSQRNPKAITYGNLDVLNRPEGSVIPTHLREISDAAFKKEDTSGHSMRGACYMRCLGKETSDMIVTRKGHLLDYQAKQQRRVTRATFTSELQGGCDTIDRGFILLQTLDEMQTGRISAAEALKRREHGGFAVPAALYLDALSVYAAITATFVKTPADNGVLVHCLYVRELLDHDVLQALIWQDTRDMLADGLTKGAVDRKALHEAMDGLVVINHECKLWRPKHLLKNEGKE